MARVYNFSAGPAVLPEDVLKQCADEMLDYAGWRHERHGDEPPIFRVQGHHRGRGGAPALPHEHPRQLQGHLHPRRRLPALCHRFHEPGRQRQGRLRDHRQLGQEGLPGGADPRRRPRPWHPRPTRTSPTSPTAPTCPSARTRATSTSARTNTIYGTKFPELPNTKGPRARGGPELDVPLRARGTSPRYGLIHAGVQKNVGPAGVQIVIVREGPRAGRASRRAHDAAPSRPRSTPARSTTRPTAGGIYVCGLVFEWIEKMGGLAAMGGEKRREGQGASTTSSTSPELFSSHRRPGLSLAHERPPS